MMARLAFALVIVGLTLAPGVAAAECAAWGPVSSAEAASAIRPRLSPATMAIPKTMKTDSGVPTTPPKAPAARETVAAPPLDLAKLEKRLRDTKAIGVFTKLTLKNQVEDLLQEIKSFHEGHAEGTLAELRERYNLLMLKVLSLLQRDDPQLARDLSASREALWAILADPEKFASMAKGG